MKTKTITLYSFDELSDAAKERAINKLSDINVNYPNWNHTDEDAKQIGLKIIELSQHGRNQGEFITSAEDCARLILVNHGEQCETYKTAKTFLDEYLPAKEKWESIKDNEGFPFEYEDQADELATDFLQSLLEDYRIMSEKEYEYQTSEEAIIETIKANEYDFDEEGNLA